jgi:hypothetical protein
MIELGLHCMHGVRLGDEPSRLERIAKLVTDSRWHWKFKLINVAHLPNTPPEPVFTGQVAAADLPEAARKALFSGAVDDVQFGVSRTASTDTARLFVKTGRYPNERSWGNSRLRLPDHDTDRIAAAWVELQHDLVDAIGARHGVIIATPTHDLMRIETWLSNISLEGRPLHPRPAEISSYAVHKAELGHVYLRAPRWGTYLAPEHLEKIGGRASVIASVDPAVIRDVGPLVYFQLTEHVSDALSPSTEVKRARFEQLVAPLLPPREPS